MTAVFVSSGPLRYHIACYKPLSTDSKVVPFLQSVLSQLGSFVRFDALNERRILEQCVKFSIRRIETYEHSLKIAFGTAFPAEVYRFRYYRRKGSPKRGL